MLYQGINWETLRFVAFYYFFKVGWWNEIGEDEKEGETLMVSSFSYVEIQCEWCDKGLTHCGGNLTQCALGGASSSLFWLELGIPTK